MLLLRAWLSQDSPRTLWDKESLGGPCTQASTPAGPLATQGQGPKPWVHNGPKNLISVLQREEWGLRVFVTAHY